MEIINKIIKKEIQNLNRINDAFDRRFDYLRLDKNERLLPFKKMQLADFKAKIKFEDISGYAELGQVYRRLAAYLGVREDGLFLASGSDLVIKSVYETCVDKGDNVVLHAPSYAMYRVYARMFGAKEKIVPIKKNWRVDISGMLSQVDSRTKFLALENPNGFVGTGISPDEIEYCARRLRKKNVLLLVDEAYYYIEHTKPETVNLIAKYPNLIISQTFSKAHGLAGARIGYLVGDSKLIEYISRVRPMHEITSLTARAVEWVLENPRMLSEYQKEIIKSKAYLKKELLNLGIRYRDTQANFMLLYIPDEKKTIGLPQKLRDRMILIRRPFQEDYLSGWARVCVGSLSDSRIFIKSLKEILKNQPGS